MNRLAAAVAIVAGVVLLVTPLATSMFGRTADAERILDRFEFLTLGDSPQRYLSEAAVTRAGSAELGATDPRIAEATRFSVRYSRQLDAVDEKFRSVYDIPAPALPLTATPWLFVLGGLACLGAGLAALRGRGGTVAVLVLGIGMVAGPLAFGALGKAADGEDVKDFATRGLSAEAARTASEAWTALDAVIEERRAQPPEPGRPAAARLLEEWDTIGPRLSRLAGAVGQSLDEFDSARRLPIALPVWLLLGAGAAMALAGAAALTSSRATRAGPPPAGQDPPRAGRRPEGAAA